MIPDTSLKEAGLLFLSKALNSSNLALNLYYLDVSIPLGIIARILILMNLFFSVQLMF